MLWILGFDMKERMIKYVRIVYFVILVRDISLGEVKKEGRIRYRLNSFDKENLKMGLR